MSGMIMRLDSLGRPAWIAVMVLGFILFWPIGLAILFYLIWSRRMGCGYQSTSPQGGWSGWGDHARARWERKMAHLQEKMARWQACRPREAASSYGGFAPSGNRAFDEYRAETLKRLEEEAKEFRDYLERLRHAKDKSEFDAFMNERRTRPAQPEEPGKDERPQG